MAFITADRVKDTSTTTGTGNITVSGSAPFGYRTFSTVLSVSDTFYYCIQGQGTSEWEVGLGTYVSSNQFARTTVLSSSASGSAVSFSSGTKNVFITLPANKTLQFDVAGTPTAGGILYGTGSMLAYSAVGTAGQFLQSTGSGAPTWATAVTGTSISNGTSNVTIASSNGAITAVTAGTTAMTVDTSGNVEVFTGAAWVSTGIGPSGKQLTLGYDTTNSIGYIRSANNGTAYTPLYVDGSFIRFNTGSASLVEAMRIDASGNVGVGATANASAILDAQSTTKGVRFPNMTTTQKNAVSSPAAGLVVFDTTLAKLCVYSGSAWQTITSI